MKKSAKPTAAQPRAKTVKPLDLRTKIGRAGDASEFIRSLRELVSDNDPDLAAIKALFEHQFGTQAAEDEFNRELRSLEDLSNEQLERIVNGEPLDQVLRTRNAGK